MAKKLYNFRMEENEKYWLEQMAKHKGISLSKLMRRGALLYADFPQEFLDALEEPAKKLEMPVHKVMMHMCIKQIAFQYAWLEVFGKAPPGAFKEFRFDEEGLVTGDKLLCQLKDEGIALLKDIKANLEKSKKTGKAVEISKEAMAVFHAQL